MKKYIEDKVMPITAYCSPQPATEKAGGIDSRITLEQYQFAKECGVNIILCHMEIFGTKTEPDAFKALDLAEQVGIKCFVRDACAEEYISLGGVEHRKKSYLSLTDEEKADLDSRFEESLKKYRDHPGFAGISFWDEPGVDSFDAIANAKKVFERVCPGKMFFVNHYPYYITPEQYQFGFWCKGGKSTIPELAVTEGKRNIDRYMYMYDKFIEKVKPEAFSYDAYPFVSFEALKTSVHEILWEMPQYLHGMEVKNGVPFWSFLQVGGQWEGNLYVRQCTEEECRLGVSIPLLYGAKGLQLFPYMYPNDWLGDNLANAGVIDRYGKKTRWFDYYKRIFRHVKAMQSRLMTAKLNAIVNVGRYENNLPEEKYIDKILWNECIFRGKLSHVENIEVPLPYKSLKSVSAQTQVLVGCMENEGKEIYFIVNNSSTVSVNATLTFDKKHLLTIIRDGETIKSKSASYSAELLAGECVLLEVTK